MKINYGVIHCYVCICLTPLQFMPRPGSSQVLSAAASDVEMEGGIDHEQQHTFSMAQRKRPPEDNAEREWKRQKDSDSAGQQSGAIIDANWQRSKMVH